ncbi:hypothetical protein KAR28_04690 [Candidatus Parcubacteria bacterium]|nr:hypothetical protein [Candidatus Parcubacteria bacterium]
MKKKNDKNLFELPVKEQERIMRDAANKANKAQQDLVRRYDRKYGKIGVTSSC